MVIYRIAKTSYIRDLSGTGAKLYGGRWNEKGTAMIYASQHRSLAILEFMVHTSLQSFPEDISMLSLEVPHFDTAQKVMPAELPDSWRESPALFQLASTGSEWIKSASSLLLKVPSAVVPQEWNILINPAHKDAGKISIKKVSSFILDSRFSNK